MRESFLRARASFARDRSSPGGGYKKDAPFLRAVDSQALCAVHQDLRQAFTSLSSALYPER